MGNANAGNVKGICAGARVQWDALLLFFGDAPNFAISAQGLQFLLLLWYSVKNPKKEVQKQMKKGLLALGTSLLLVLFSVGALAEGQATITQQTAQTYAYEDVFYAYYFAQIENTGDVPIVLDGGTLELYNSEGQAIYSTPVYSCYPSVLAPGEKGFVREYTNLDSLNTMAAYKFDLVARPAGEGSVIRLNCTADFSQQTLYGDDMSTTLKATVMNDKQETVSNIMIVYALYDAEGKLIFVDTLSPYYLGIPAGNSVELSTAVDPEIEASWAERGIRPASAYALAYIIAD